MTDPTDKNEDKSEEGFFMAGFSGATGVPLKQMQDAIAQSTAYAFTEATTLVGITAGMNQIRRAGNTVIFTLRGTVNTEIPAFSNGRIVVPNEYKPRGSTNIVAAYRVGDAVKVETWQVMNDGNVRCGDNIPTGALWVSLVYPI
jgi:hypothetical protein